MSDWYTTRVQWNAEGKCAREACRGPLPTDHENYNTGCDLFYCDRCRDFINQFTAGLVVRREVGS